MKIKLSKSSKLDNYLESEVKTKKRWDNLVDKVDAN